ncbi:MAG: peptidylprolyl isomerase [Magnetococcales bacterium]|nr:peptidylprolyl isomerase [Magnetococcales bacterium]MBF0151464.1 peptidylprolyl isomerase [Magnetococcales bacterium]MBF0174490.1 peptidylprolyl isomerase [Magnetococcales bacterium]MBF0632477.1 peptidylprolyl isomerase [Magnetococcales bacterium]
MITIKNGDIIAMHYTGTLEDGQVFDSSIARDEPIRFTVGDAELIPGLEKELLGMAVGEAKRVHVGMMEAYGEWMEELVRDFPRELFPEGMELETGLRFSLSQEEGREMFATITEINGDVITLDANHPLAGENLIFDVEILEIVPDSD